MSVDPFKLTEAEIETVAEAPNIDADTSGLPVFEIDALISERMELPCLQALEEIERQHQGFRAENRIVVRSVCQSIARAIRQSAKKRAQENGNG